ncbi:MAG: class I SAM-dependent RNA methyltransferase, partial [Rhodococcus sp.]|nr:class I SAM-dependent RNA methyltransferase [Rhodococcus sp. (in: high G+C Gram-positive bacteria)]
MTDSKPRKTLTLARKAAPAATSAEDAGTRKRSGARARQVAQLRHEQEKGVLPNTETRPSAARKRPAARRSEPVSPTPSAEVDRPRIVRTRSERPHGKQRPSRRQEIFQAFAPCPMGLEEALHAELEALGYGGLIKARAGCHFEADWMGILKANLYSRLATRVLVRVAHAPVRTEDDILALARDTEWERWFGSEQTLRVDTSA